MSFLFKRTNIIIDEFNHICHPRKQFLLKLRHEDFTTYPTPPPTPPKKTTKTKQKRLELGYLENKYFIIIIFQPVLILSF